MIGRHHHGHHRVAPERGVIGQQNDRLSSRRHLHGAGHRPLRIEGSAVARPSARSTGAPSPAQPQPHPVAGRSPAKGRGRQPGQRVGGEPLGVRPGHHSQLARPGDVSPQVIARAATTPRHRGDGRPATVPVPKWPGPIGRWPGSRTESAPPELAARHRHMGPQTGPHPAHLQRVSRRPTGGTCPAGTVWPSSLRSGPPPTDGHAGSGPGRAASAPAPSPPMPPRRPDCPPTDWPRRRTPRVTGTGAGHPDGGHAQASGVLQHRPQSRLDHLENLR